MSLIHQGGGKRALPGDAKTAKAIEQARAIAATLAKQTATTTTATTTTATPTTALSNRYECIRLHAAWEMII